MKPSNDLSDSNSCALSHMKQHYNHLHSKDDLIPLFILVPRAIIGDLIGKGGCNVRQLATSTRTKIHIDTNKKGLNANQAIVKVAGPAEGCAEVAFQISVKIFKKSRHPCRDSLSLRVSFPRRFHQHLVENKKIVESVEAKFGVMVQEDDMSVKNFSFFEIFGTHDDIAKTVLSFMNEIHGLYYAGFMTDQNTANTKLSTDERLYSWQCEVEFYVPYKLAVKTKDDFDGLFADANEINLNSIKEIEILVGGKLTKMVVFHLSGKLLDLLRAQHCIYQSMRDECDAENNPDLFARLDFKISKKSGEITRRGGRFNAENVRECQGMKFEQEKGNRVGVCLEGKFYNVQLTFKSLMMIEIQNSMEV